MIELSPEQAAALDRIESFPSSRRARRGGLPDLAEVARVDRVLERCVLAVAVSNLGGVMYLYRCSRMSANPNLFEQKRHRSVVAAESEERAKEIIYGVEPERVAVELIGTAGGVLKGQLAQIILSRWEQ